MRVRIALVVLILLGGARLEAGILGGILTSKPKLPKARSPIFDAKVDEDHKIGHRQRHPGKYNDITWGSMWKQTLFQDRNFHLSHSNQE